MIREILLFSSVLTNLLIVSSSIADEKYSAGAGVGALYNGVGVNLGIFEDYGFKYASIGCISIGYSSKDGLLSNCGLGIGWIRSDILSDSNRHGLGIHLGTSYNTHNNRNNLEAFIGIPYVYLFDGMGSDGWNIGVTPIIGENHGDIEGGVLLNLGYQF